MKNQLDSRIKAAQERAAERCRQIEDRDLKDFHRSLKRGEIPPLNKLEVEIEEYLIRSLVWDGLYILYVREELMEEAPITGTHRSYSPD